MQKSLRVVILAEWKRRVQGRTYQGRKYPLINLPVELQDWIGKKVKIIEVSPKEVIIKLED